MVSMRDSKILAATMNVSNDAGRDGFHSVPDLARADLRRKDQGRSGIRPYRFMLPMRVRFWRWRLPRNLRLSAGRTVHGSTARPKDRQGSPRTVFIIIIILILIILL